MAVTGAERERELELLTRPQLRDLIESAGVKLVGYKDLLKEYGTQESGPLLHRRSAA